MQPQQGAIPFHSIVQSLAWPTAAEDEPFGSNSNAAPAATRRPWHDRAHLAHPLQFSQMLQPAVTAPMLQVWAALLVSQSCIHTLQLPKPARDLWELV